MRSQIIQFVTGQNASIAANYATPTAQQRFVLNQTTGQVFWDVHGVRHSVNAIVNIDNTISVSGQNPVAGSAVWEYGQQLKTDIERAVPSIVSAAVDIPTITQTVTQDRTQVPSGGAVYSFVTAAISATKQYTNSKVSATLSSISSSYIPVTSITSAVQINDMHIPTGGAVYSFVHSAVDQLQPENLKLAGLIDTDINGPANGQVLAYNRNTSKWYNKTIQTGSAGISWTLYT